MNGFAAIIAGYGLLSNSSAVVIGAMLIAMLLGPIMGFALALVDGDTKLLRRAVESETIGAAMVALIGLVIGLAHRSVELTPEIFARTNPNILDLAIALAGGAAGAYATASMRVSTGLVGVAISTALAPPLVSCGICISRAEFGLAFGAFLLFFTNLVAIQCASSAVLYVLGYHEVTSRKADDRTYLRRLGIDAAVLLFLTIFLYFQLVGTISKKQFERVVREQLVTQFSTIPGALLSDLMIRESKGETLITAVVSVPNSVTPQQTAQIERELVITLRRRITLHVRSLLTKETTSAGYLHEMEPRPSETNQGSSGASSQLGEPSGGF